MLNVSQMHRIPWTKDDNPNGWVEVTTWCQLDCPGCYRGFDDSQEAPPAENLLELEQDVDTLIRIRNIQTLSIAGGEPLLFPLLDELISYSHSRGVAPRLFTNAVRLTEKRLRALASAGCAEVMIHASLWQNRLKPNTLVELLKPEGGVLRAVQDGWRREAGVHRARDALQSGQFRRFVRLLPE